MTELEAQNAKESKWMKQVKKAEAAQVVMQAKIIFVMIPIRWMTIIVLLLMMILVLIMMIILDNDDDENDLSANKYDDDETDLYILMIIVMIAIYQKDFCLSKNRILVFKRHDTPWRPIIYSQASKCFQFNLIIMYRGVVMICFWI